jgi:2-oxoglutarate/2-oxoacid ferredoxin oxidoreductase subunit beta
VITLPQHDGSVCAAQAARRLRPDRPRRAMNHVHALQASGEVVTGLLYVDPSA